MRKIFSFLSIVVLLFSFFGCQNNTTNPSTPTATPTPHIVTFKITGAYLIDSVGDLVSVSDVWADVNFTTYIGTWTMSPDAVVAVPYFSEDLEVKSNETMRLSVGINPTSPSVLYVTVEIWVDSGPKFTENVYVGSPTVILKTYDQL